MSARPSILCPVDFSDASRNALRYGAMLAEHFGTGLTVLAIDDPFLAAAAAATRELPPLADETTHELRVFVADTLQRSAPGAMTVDCRVSVGTPAPEILRIAVAIGADLIVMSSHGRSGVKKLFFGSTTERVLRETPIPVLVTPEGREGAAPSSVTGLRVNRVLAPVDLSPASPYQVAIASGIASALAAPLILTHVIEPIFIPARLRNAMTGIDATRRADCEERLASLAESRRDQTPVETSVLSGEPADEIVKLADVRDARLIVIGLHSSSVHGPRMGSVTYRVLCLTRALVLAIPPKPLASVAPVTTER